MSAGRRPPPTTLAVSGQAITRKVQRGQRLAKVVATGCSRSTSSRWRPGLRVHVRMAKEPICAGTGRARPWFHFTTPRGRVES